MGNTSLTKWHVHLFKELGFSDFPILKQISLEILIREDSFCNTVVYIIFRLGLYLLILGNKMNGWI